VTGAAPGDTSPVGSRPLAPVLLLAAACGARDPGPTPAPGATNLGLAGRALHGQGELWALVVREAEQGGLDRNGDGDAEDDVLVVLDLGPGAESGAGAESVLSSVELAPVELALGESALDGPAAVAVGAELVLFAVSEIAQGGRDLDGDGDAEDLVAHVYERGPRAVQNLGLAVGRARAPAALDPILFADGELCAFAVDEDAQGADLDGDGRADGSVLHVFDGRTGAVQSLSIHGSVPLALHDGVVAFGTREVEGLDLDLDGDVEDTVLELFDVIAGEIHVTGLALAGGGVVAAGGAFGLSVSEHDQGQRDLDGDGDAEDAVFVVYDPLSGATLNLGLVVPLYPPPATDGERFLLHALEEPTGRDANGDGDRADLVVYVFEPRARRLIATGLATTGVAAFAGNWLGVSVSEAMQGVSDLDGDGGAAGDVVVLLELTTGFAQELGLDARTLVGGDGVLFVLPDEETAKLDWNADGDQRDGVLFEWSAAGRRLTSSGRAVGRIAESSGRRALVTLSEEGEGRDANGDGDRFDVVLARYDAGRGRLDGLGLAAGRALRLGAGGCALALVEEDAQGADLNGDGDRADEVLYLVP